MNELRLLLILDSLSIKNLCIDLHQLKEFYTKEDLENLLKSLEEKGLIAKEKNFFNLTIKGIKKIIDYKKDHQKDLRAFDPGTFTNEKIKPRYRSLIKSTPCFGYYKYSDKKCKKCVLHKFCLNKLYTKIEKIAEDLDLGENNEPYWWEEHPCPICSKPLGKNTIWRIYIGKVHFDCLKKLP